METEFFFIYIHAKFISTISNQKTIQNKFYVAENEFLLKHITQNKMWKIMEIIGTYGGCNI